MIKSVTKIVKQRKPLFQQLEFSSPIPQLLKRIYLNRGISNESEIHTELSGLLSFHSLLNIEKASKLLADGIQNQQKFMVIGDFDTDGATSTALAVKALKTLGAIHVEYLIPNRFEYGYGLTPEIVNKAAQHHPNIIITVDNGISSHEGVLRAKYHGIKTLITDHHLSPEILPDADVIINPNQPLDTFHSKHIAGVGVIFYVMLALRDYLKAKHINMAQFLDLVALGTVADVVSLDKNNRILVYHGINRIRSGACSPGILALLQTNRRKIADISPSDLGYTVAPRLNAAGRLEDMSLGVACLLSEDKTTAENYALELEQLNSQRREIESEMTYQAEKVLPQVSLENISTGLCLYHTDFHQGVIGILAGRLKDRFHRPVVVFAKVNETELKGSARSIPGCHLRDILALIDTKNPGLINKFGGHAMAAGLSIDEKSFQLFSTIFNQTLENAIQPEILNNIILTDGELQADELSIDSALLLQNQLIWGQGFPEPLFQGNFVVLDQKLINQKHLKLRLRYGESNSTIDAIAFNHPEHISAQSNKTHINIVYRLSINDYMGLKTLQLIIEHFAH